MSPKPLQLFCLHVEHFYCNLFSVTLILYAAFTSHVFNQNIHCSRLDGSCVHVRAHTVQKLSRDLRSARTRHSCCQNLPCSRELSSCFHANMKVDPVCEATVDVLVKNMALTSLFQVKLQVGWHHRSNMETWYSSSFKMFECLTTACFHCSGIWSDSFPM